MIHDISMLNKFYDNLKRLQFPLNISTSEKINSDFSFWIWEKILYCADQ